MIEITDNLIKRKVMELAEEKAVTPRHFAENGTDGTPNTFNKNYTEKNAESQLLGGIAEKCINEENLRKVVFDERKKFMEDAKKAVEGIFRRFFYVKDKLYIVHEADVHKIDVNTLPILLEKEITGVIGEYTVKKSGGTETKKLWTIDPKAVRAYLQTNRYDILFYKIDPFLKKRKIEKDRDAREIRIYLNKIRLREPQAEIDQRRYEEVVADYRTHFPLLDEFLDFVAACRFSVSRKESFLYLRTPSNWGKSFLFGALEDLGTLFEMRYSDFVEDRPVGLEPLQLRNSFIVGIDEFTYFPKELKKLTHYKVVEPKFGFREKVEVFAKIFTSAEQSESFENGVDEQIRNRVVVFDLHNYDVGKLTDRETYKRDTYTYYEAVKRYLYSELRRRIDEYLRLGRSKANKKADSILRDIWERYKIPESENLLNKIRETIIEYIKEILAKDEHIGAEKEIRNSLIKQEDGKIAVIRPTKTFDIILRAASEEGFYKKARYKKSEIRKLLGGEEKSVRIGKNVVKAYVFKLEDDFPF